MAYSQLNLISRVDFFIHYLYKVQYPAYNSRGRPRFSIYL